MFSSSIFTNDIKCFFINDRECKGFSVARMGIGSWFQNLAAIYENDLSPELLTLSRTKERTLFLVLYECRSCTIEMPSLKYRGAFPWTSLCILVETICCTLNLTGSYEQPPLKYRKSGISRQVVVNRRFI